MLFVISEEVIPEINRERNGGINSVGLLTGFVVMMMLDVVLG
jgi:ZIP family zinc transporter